MVLVKLEMIVKKHKTSDGRLILAVCDKELLGKIFEDNEKRLDLSSDFYKGEEEKDNKIKKLFSVAYIINIVGEKSVSLALQEKIISKKDITFIKNIPHTQVVIMKDV